MVQWYPNECLRFSWELNNPDGVNKVVITPVDIAGFMIKGTAYGSLMDKSISQCRQ